MSAAVLPRGSCAARPLSANATPEFRLVRRYDESLRHCCLSRPCPSRCCRTALTARRPGTVMPTGRTWSIPRCVSFLRGVFAGNRPGNAPRTFLGKERFLFIAATVNSTGQNKKHRLYTKLRDGCRQRALARAIRASDQSERWHVKRRLTRVRAGRRSAIPEAATGPGGPRSACRSAIPPRSVQQRRRTLPRDRQQMPPAGLAIQLAMRPGQSLQSKCWREP